MKVTQTDSEVIITFDKDSDEYKYGFLKLIDIADLSNAEMVNFTSEFRTLLKKADPKEQVADHWDDMFIKFTGACLDQMVADSSVLAGLISNFYNQIGEAMGPVSYAGFELRRYFRDHEPDNVAYQDWVDDCIYYYEQLDFCK